MLGGMFTGLYLPSMKRAVRHLALFLLAWLWVLSARAQTPQLDLPRIRLQAGMHQMEVQVAQSPRQHQIGLMFRTEMPAHEGMLFVFDQPSVQCFWMRNTLIPLTAAFLADDGTIVNLADMQPLSEASHCSLRPVRYVLEMNQGWFSRRGLAAGARLSGPVFAR